ncbi:MAG: hypothetical protein JAY74_03640 [Candidatus Thiodiazotropha taylori]|nr:hypothetical protein [Candidatus Thiodiazotropha taylori]
MKRALTGFFFLLFSSAAIAFEPNEDNCFEIQQAGILLFDKMDKGAGLGEVIKYWKGMRKDGFSDYDMSLIEWMWSRRSFHKYAIDAAESAEEWCYIQYPLLKSQLEAKAINKLP